MPDLSDIATPVMLVYSLNAKLRGAGPTDPKAQAYATGFIQVVDKAIFEYEAARATLIEFCRSRNRSSLYLRTVAHLETCIGSIKRAQRLLVRLKSTLGRPGLPKAARLRIEHAGDAVRQMRDPIEHMDEWILDDKFGDGDLVALAVSDQGDEVGIAAHTMTFEELAKLLRALRETALVLADYRAADQPMPNAGT